MPRRAPAPDLPAALVDALVAARGDRPAPAWEQRVLDATSALIGEHGLHHWTVEDVADRSEVGRATLYRRYGSRDGLIQAAVTRDARAFFAAISAAVLPPPGSERPPPGAPGAPEPVPDMVDLVVDGLMAGLRLVRATPLGELIARDPQTAVGLLTSGPVIPAATVALADRYQAMRGQPLRRSERARVEARAEALVRLAVSFVLVPGDLESAGQAAARRRLSEMVAPLIGPLPANPGQFRPAERSRPN